MTKSASPETTDVMQFRVTIPLRSIDTSTLPFYLGEFHRLPRRLATRTRDVILIRKKDEYGRSLNLLDDKMWIDCISERIEVNTTEVWRIINIIDDNPHPIHLLIFTGTSIPPDPYERGWKDMVRTPFGYVTSIITRFGPFSGRYIWHCHMLEHEDYEMMRPMEEYRLE